jgi:hypothetical protein
MSQQELGGHKPGFWLASINGPLLRKARQGTRSPGAAARGRIHDRAVWPFAKVRAKTGCASSAAIMSVVVERKRDRRSPWRRSIQEARVVNIADSGIGQ